MHQATQNWLTLVGRIALAWLFIEEGFGQLMSVEATVGYMQKFGMPMAEILVWGAIAVELLGGLALAVGWKARWAAAFLAVFLLITMFVFHAYWAVDAAQMVTQRIQFLKNLSILGGMLVVMASGPGSYSFDGRARR